MTADGNDLLVCPSCGARMRGHRRRCLRCEAPLPMASKPASARRPGARWRGAAIAAAAVVLVAVASAVIAWRTTPAPRQAGTATASIAVVRPAGPQAPQPRDQARPPVLPPSTPDPQQVARVAYHSGDYDAAFDKYREATERDPNDAESFSNAGQALVRLGRVAEAVPYFQRAIELNGNRWAYRFNLARAHGLLSQWDQAVEQYRVAAGLFPGDYATEYNLGMALHKRGSEAEAVGCFKRAIALRPSEADLYLSLGISSERLGLQGDAVDAYRRYLELAPASPDAAKVRAKVGALAGETNAPR
jgi:tetratricopeptide (TPR) repeat protein